MKLLGSDLSPYVRKVRVVMAEKRIEYKYEPVDVWATDGKLQQFNPLGKIPCLVLEDGMSIYDSRVIVEYLDTLTPVHRLIPPTGRARIEVKCWEALADGILDAAVAVRLESLQRPEGQRSDALVKRQLGKIDTAMAAMAASIGDKPWCLEGRYSLADIATGCALGYLDLRFPQIEWRARHPNLRELAEKIFARPAFAETMPPR